MPYSKGWKVQIDGKNEKIYQINDLYMGIVLDQGKHQIVFKYETLGLRVGAIISILSLILIILLYFIKYKKSVQKYKK